MADSILLPVRPCVKCGTSERYANGSCKSCRKALNAAWRAKSSEVIKAYSAQYHAQHKESRAASARASRLLADPKKRRAADVAYYQANRAKIIARKKTYIRPNTSATKAAAAARAKASAKARAIYRQNRKARKLLSGGHLSKGLHKKLFYLQKGKCPCCALPLGDDFHLDHKMPLALGGSNTDDNIQLLRAVCNLQKNSKHPVDFMRSRGFLL